MMSEPKYVPKNNVPIFLKLHSTADFVVIAPYIPSTNYNLAKLITDSDLFFYWCFSFASFVIVRIVISLINSLEKRKLNALTSIPFNTFGLFLATTSAQSIRSKSERIIVTFIAIGSIFTGTFCSGVLLQKFTGSSWTPFFNSMYDLEKIPLKYKSNQFVLTDIMDKRVK